MKGSSSMTPREAAAKMTEVADAIDSKLNRVREGEIMEVVSFQLFTLKALSEMANAIRALNHEG